MKFELNAIISQIGKDKGIDKKVLIEAIESAMLSAAKKHFGHCLNLETSYNIETGEMEVVEFKVVVEEVEDEDTQISLKDAREKFDPDAMVGDELGRKLDSSVLGRIAAQTAKQVIVQKLRDAERGVIYEEYKGSKGDTINGIVQRYEKGNVIINLGRTEAVLPKREQIEKERYRQGDRVRSMILDIDRSARGPQIILSRSHPNFLRKLFEQEVPEIAEGIIQIKSVAREPGERAKIAVYAEDSAIDPVGACVGVKGSRVQGIVQELRGERIDIITWTSDEPSFVARALSPAEVTRVVMDEDERTMEVVVSDDQLSLAIGKGGQNVKLASKLTGWKIDVRSVGAVEKENKQVLSALESIKGVDFSIAQFLLQDGFRSVRSVADATEEELLEIEGITPELVKGIIESAKEITSKEEVSTEVKGGIESSDLTNLNISDDIKNKLFDNGFHSMQELAIADVNDKSVFSFLNEEEVSILKNTLEEFFKKEKKRDIF
ncbi:MAG: transcription termination factor NusA [Bdellovibrionota bacterium]